MTSRSNICARCSPIRSCAVRLQDQPDHQQPVRRPTSSSAAGERRPRATRDDNARRHHRLVPGPQTSGDGKSPARKSTPSSRHGNVLTFDFGKNTYLKSITLTKLQFSFDQESSADVTTAAAPPPPPIKAHFGIWGSMVFNELKVLDIFSFEKLAFSDLGIAVDFDLTIYPGIRTTPRRPPRPSRAHLRVPATCVSTSATTIARSNADSLLSLCRSSSSRSSIPERRPDASRA